MFHFGIVNHSTWLLENIIHRTLCINVSIKWFDTIVGNGTWITTWIIILGIYHERKDVLHIFLNLYVCFVIKIDKILRDIPSTWFYSNSLFYDVMCIDLNIGTISAIIHIYKHIHVYKLLCNKANNDISMIRCFMCNEED